MEKLLLNTENGVAGLLASIVLILCLHLLMNIGKFLLEMFKKKSELSEKSIRELTVALDHNSKAVEELKATVLEIPKFKKDLRRLFSVAKILAGDEWNEMLKQIVEEEKLKGH